MCMARTWDFAGRTQLWSGAERPAGRREAAHDGRDRRAAEPCIAAAERALAAEEREALLLSLAAAPADLPQAA